MKIALRTVFLILGLVSGSGAWAATNYIDIIAQPAAMERIGDGLLQAINKKADGKISGDSELNKLRRVLELAGWTKPDRERLINSGRLYAEAARKVMGKLPASPAEQMTLDWFLDELKSSPLSNQVFSP